ncbi:MAG: FCD domain-containing protein [Actinomycetota bacterium]|nr:FCD domain-containing protein [Actinomycetota bacterium]
MYVRSRQERVVLTNRSHDEIEPRTLLELLDARGLIEPRLAEMTARNADEDEIAELQRLLKKAEEYLGGSRHAPINSTSVISVMLGQETRARELTRDHPQPRCASLGCLPQGSPALVPPSSFGTRAHGQDGW